MDVSVTQNVVPFRIMPRTLTSHQTVMADLALSLRARLGVDAGFTFGEFIEACRLLGVQDTDQLGLIEFGVAATGCGLLSRDEDEHGCVELREVVSR